MKTLFLAILAALPLAATAQATAYCSYTFSPPALPEGTMTYDLDGQTLHFSALQAGFNQGEAWMVMREEGQTPDNWFAASTSRYKKADDGTVHPADDWMVLPPVYVRADDAALTWRSRSICENLNTPGCYAVRVSTEGAGVEDFPPSTILATISGEAPGPWTEHRLDLGAYAGKRVWIAFVNTTQNGETLAVDDVVLSGSQGTCSFDITTPPYVVASSVFTPSITFTLLSEQPVGPFTAHLEELRSGQSWTLTLPAPDLQAGESMEIPMAPAMPAATGDTLLLRAWLDLGSTSTDVVERQVVYVAFRPRQSVVVEEGTGAWCGYCPRGIVAMRRLKEKYGEAIVPVAVHYDDIMEVEGYISSSGILFPLGFPSGEVNRAHTALPMQQYWDEDGEHWTMLEGGFETWVVDELSRLPMAEVGLEATLEGRTLTLTSRLRFCVPQQEADLRIAYILTEDAWSHPAVAQKNYLSGCGLPFDGFEDLPGSIPGFVFEDVARGAAMAAFQGIEGSVPAHVEAEQTVEHSVQMEVPDIVQDPSACHVAALLIDHSTGRIVGACRTSLAGAAALLPPLAAPCAPASCHDLYGHSTTPQAPGIYILGGRKTLLP